VAGKNTTVFMVNNTVDSIITRLTVGVTVVPGAFSNRSDTSAVIGQSYYAGDDAVLRIVARDKFGNERDSLIQPPLIDIFSVPATAGALSSVVAVVSEQANPDITLTKSEGEHPTQMALPHRHTKADHHAPTIRLHPNTAPEKRWQIACQCFALGPS
jgi:hypothetical protein